MKEQLGIFYFIFFKFLTATEVKCGLEKEIEKIKILGEEEEVNGGRRLDSTHPFIKQIYIETFLYAGTRLDIMDIAMDKASKNLPLDVLASSGADR